MTRATRVAILLVCLFPTVALADLAWPALHLEIRLLSWWVLLFGLIAGFVLVRCLFGLSVGRVLKAVIVARISSTLAGLLLTPLAGVAWEIFPGQAIMEATGWSSFNPATWAASMVFAALSGIGVDALVYRRGFGLAVGWRALAWIGLANVLGIALAFASLLWLPLGTSAY